MAAIYRRRSSRFDRTLDMHVCNLRKKLGGRGALISTVRGRRLPLPGRAGTGRGALRCTRSSPRSCSGRSGRSASRWSPTGPSRGPSSGGGRAITTPSSGSSRWSRTTSAWPTSRGGRSGSPAQLRKLDAYLPGEHFLTDAGGRDLVTGEDRSGLLKARGSLRRPAPAARRPPDPHHPAPRHGDGGRYRFVTVVRPWFDPPNFLPVLRGDRPGDRRDGRGPGRAPGRAAPEPPPGGGPLRPGRTLGAGRLDPEGRDRRARRGPSTRWPGGSRRC